VITLTPWLLVVAQVRHGGHKDLNCASLLSTPNRQTLTQRIYCECIIGFVPCLSLLQQHIEKCISLDPNQYDKRKKKNHELLGNLALDKSNHELFGNLSLDKSMHVIAGLSIDEQNEETKRGWDKSTRINSSSERRKNSQKVKLRICAHVSFQIAFAVGLMMFCLTLSWGQLEFEISEEMKTFLSIGAITFHILYLILALVKQQFPSLGFFVDLVFLLLGLGGDWYWWRNGPMGKELILYTILMSYPLMRFWGVICSEVFYNPIREANNRRSDLLVYDRVTFVWVARSAKSVSEVIPLLNELWLKLEDAWGYDLAFEVCRMQVYCTDRNTDACQVLTEEVWNTSLYDCGCLHFGRPSIPEILEEHSIDANIENESSSTVLAFCGSGAMGSILKQSKLLHDIWLASVGMIGHNYELQAHSYGGHISKTKKVKPGSTKRNDEDSQRKSVNASWVIPSLETHRQKSVYRDEYNVPVFDLEASGSVNSRINEYNVPVFDLEASGSDNSRINAAKSNLRRIELEHYENSQSSANSYDNEGGKTLHQNRSSVQDSAEVSIASNQGNSIATSTSTAPSHHNDIGTSFKAKYEVVSRVSDRVVSIYLLS